MTTDEESERIADLLARLATLREENERLRAELALYRKRDHETPPHYL